MENKEFKAGFGRVDITPVEPVPLAGYGNTSRRLYKAIRDEIYTTCVAISDPEGVTALLFHVDLISLTTQLTQEIRQAVSLQTGVDQEKIILCCTHTHSAPDVQNDEVPAQLRYNAALPDKFAQAAQEAMSDRKMAQLYYGSVEVYNMNFVKHYKHVSAEGEVKYFGDNFGTEVLDETTTHATDADTTLYIMKLARQGGKDIIMANWRAHGVLTGGSKRYILSADLAGSFREQMEKEQDCLFAFYQGAAGNINPLSRMMEEEITRDCLAYGKIMASHAGQCLQNMTLAKPGPIKFAQKILDGQVDHSKDHIIEQAQEVRKVWMETYDHAKVRKVAQPYGIRSPYQANAIIARYSTPATLDLELNALCLGPDVGIVTAPNELFDTLSVMIEEASSFPVTLTFGYCGAYRGYIPSKLGFEYSCYESDCTRFAPGIGEQIAENLTQMLNALQ